MAGADGMSTSRQRRGGGMFNYEVRFILKHSKADKSIESLRRNFAAGARGAKGKNNISFQFNKGIASTGQELANGWKRAVNTELRSMMVANTAQMKQEMINFSRKDTGRMRKAIRGRTTSTPDAHISEVGWLDIWYKYFGFQEEGTMGNQGRPVGPRYAGGHFNIKGIRPMRALNKTLTRGSYRMNANLSKFSNNITAQLIKDKRR